MDQQSGDDAVEDRLCLALYRASHAMTAAYRSVLEPLQLTYPQYTVLSALWNADGRPMKQLIALLGSDYNTVSPLIKRMEAAGLLVRDRSSTDEREVLIRLTSKGRDLQPQAATVQRDVRRTTGLDDETLDQLARDLNDLARTLVEGRR